MYAATTTPKLLHAATTPKLLHAAAALFPHRYPLLFVHLAPPPHPTHPTPTHPQESGLLSFFCALLCGFHGADLHTWVGALDLDPQLADHVNLGLGEAGRAGSLQMVRDMLRRGRPVMEIVDAHVGMLAD